MVVDRKNSLYLKKTNNKKRKEEDTKRVTGKNQFTENRGKG